MTSDKKHKRPKYNLEFKQDAAKLVLEKSYSQQQAADHLGISLSALGRWIRAERKPSAHDSAAKKPSLSLENHDELIRLRKENEQLRMEREILLCPLGKKGRRLPFGFAQDRLCERSRIPTGHK